MRFLEEGESPTIEMIEEDLEINPPGQGALNIQLSFAYNAPFYVRFLLDRLKQVEQSAGKVGKKRKKK